MALFVGRAMFQVLNGIATVFIALFYAWAVFGVDFSMTNWPALITVVVLTSLTTVGFGLMLSSLGLYLAHLDGHSQHLPLHRVCCSAGSTSR